jgi:uncharacterized protein (DUF2147 family)
MMKRLFASAALLAAALLASTAAQAQYNFEYGGRTIHIDPDRGTVSIPGVYDNTGRHRRSRDRDSDRYRDNDRYRDDDHYTRKQAPDQAKVDPQGTPPAPVDQAPATAVAPANAPTDPANTTANVAPADIAAPGATANPPAPVQQDTAPVTPPAPPPVVATTPPAPAPAPPPSAPVQQQRAAMPPASSAPPSNSPLGLWLTEEKEGRVRIEQCGASLCGYSVDAKSNQNGEQVLINMKPGKDSKWSGRILDPSTGSTYDSTIAMKGTDSLRVQGCAMGGMFCGGQTWTRLN